MDLILMMPAILAAAAMTNYTHPMEHKCLPDVSHTPAMVEHVITIGTPGRYTIGDVNNDGSVDYVIANRDRLRAYDLCGAKLWDKTASLNYDIRPVGSGASENAHAYWNWSSYGWVDDVMNGANQEYLHIAEDARTLVIRSGQTGGVLTTYDLGSGEWTRALVGSERSIYATQSHGTTKIKKLKVNSAGAVYTIWTRDHGFIQSRYTPAALGDLNNDGYYDIVKGATAYDGDTGATLFNHNFTNQAVIGTHSLTVRDIDPAKAGAESIWSLYAPINGGASVIISSGTGSVKNNYYSQKHAHQHTTGQFSLASPGLEVVARHNDGRSHWLISATGTTLKHNLRLDPSALLPSWGRDLDSQSSELVQGVRWLGTELDQMLYTERHMAYDKEPHLVIANAAATAFITPVFSGGHDTSSSLYYLSQTTWAGWQNRGNVPNHDGPYEGDAHPVDVIGGGCEEVLAMSHKGLRMFYNNHCRGRRVESLWDQEAYQKRKKLWGSVYSPR